MYIKARCISTWRYENRVSKHFVIHRLKKGVSVSVFVTVTSRKPEYPQTEL